MKFFEMEFSVDGVPVYVTEPYDNLDAVLEEVTTERGTILHQICGRTEYISFDKDQRPDASDNESAIATFDYLLSNLALHGFENKNVEHTVSGIVVMCITREVKRQYTPDACNSFNITSIPC